MTMKRFCTLVLCSLTFPLGVTNVVGQEEVLRIGKQPMEVIAPTPEDYSQLAFYPERWRDAKVSFDMLAWEGQHVVLLTKKEEYDKALMSKFVSRLDQAWQTYQDLVPAKPSVHRQIGGKPTICAIPKGDLSCGLGCGFIGASGIEVAGFYNSDWPRFTKDSNTFAHYYFYEMGRNFFVFGDRHSEFTTGYAVFMRYICMDQLKCRDYEPELRKTIEQCEQVYADSKIQFMDAFTNSSVGEKGHRLRDAAGELIVPSDQPVMYAAAMLKLRRDFGDEWVKKFYSALHQCDVYPATNELTARPQCLSWLVCASMAAGKDLAPIFADRWRLPLTQKQRQILQQTKWTEGNTPAEIVKTLLASS